MKRIAVVGGGLSGLTAAYRLGLVGNHVEIFEASERLGGQLSTARDGEWVVELGAEGFVARSEAVPRLAADLGIAESLLDQSATTSFRYDGHELHALAPGEAAAALNFQVSREGRGAGIRTFAGGMQSLSDALAAAVHARSAVHVARPVESLELDGPRVRVDGGVYDAVVLATSSAAAARLLEPLVGDTGLARAETLSSVTVSLGFESAQVRHPLDGTGFVVGEPFEGFRACTFTTSKFAHRAPAGHVSLRVFFRPTAREQLEKDTPWAERATRVLGRVLPIDGAPLRCWVSQWPSALPVFTDEHRRAVRDLEEEQLRARPIHLAGSAFHGSGIDAAVRSAEALAKRLSASV